MTDRAPQRAPQTEDSLLDANVFMICRRLNPQALSTLSRDYHIRTCREEELALWKAMPFDTPTEAQAYQDSMTDYFSRVYARKGRLFYERCLFVCDSQDRPIATAFAWKAYDAFTTIHWLKVVKAYEGKGIGRALLSRVMSALNADEYPVYLHTQPGSYRAIKLYADFGFDILVDPIIGNRTNDIEASIPILEKYMAHSAFKNLKYTTAPESFIRALAQEEASEF
ncbi:GNAT family N-acetyltransferase [Kouleothrix sp.]|uniref:GNAT family N-acetyltransferase n=1 Tax=Kouleothrix sp. TaxID=2779161 RepID=UPI003919A554